MSALNNSFEFSLGNSTLDNSGNYAFTEITLHNDLSIVIGSIYGSNQDNPQFINNLAEIINSYNNPNILLGGDWNCTRLYQLDNIHYVSQNNLKNDSSNHQYVQYLLFN